MSVCVGVDMWVRGYVDMDECVCARVRVWTCACGMCVLSIPRHHFSDESAFRQMMDFNWASQDLVVVVTLVNPDSKDGSNFSLVCASRSKREEAELHHSGASACLFVCYFFKG
jgi:hypothetical protein